MISSDVIRFEVRIYGAEGLFQIIKLFVLSSRDTIESWTKKWIEITFSIYRSFECFDDKHQLGSVIKSCVLFCYKIFF